MAMLSVKDLHVHYGVIEALKGVSIDVNEGEIVSLIGANGAGKTTMLQAISGIVKKSSGDVEFLGQSIYKTNPKNIVAAGLAERAEVQLAYAIGVAQPVSIAVDTFGTGKVKESEIVEWVRELFDLRPAGIIKMLDLRRPIYKQTAAYGHFGRTDLNVPWEQTDKADALRVKARL